MQRAIVALAALVLVQACASDPRGGGGGVVDGGDVADAGTTSTLDAGTTVDGGSSDPSALVTARPFGLKVPSSYAGQPTPLVVLLHGYGANGATQAAYFGLDQLAEQRGFFLAFPDGTVDARGNRFWNADDACCDFFKTGVDDVAYIDAIIDDVAQRFRVDPKRVYVVGHSNGGFMAHRYACDRAGRVAAIVSLAGAVWKDPAKCQPAAKVAVAEIHGDADSTILYGGGSVFPGVPEYPGAIGTVATWAAKNGCDSALSATGTTLDLDSSLAGNETMVERHQNCAPGGAAELWTIHGGGHIPSLSAQFPGAVYDFLTAHPKP